MNVKTKKLLKLVLLILVLFLAINVFDNLIIQSPKDVVEKTLREFNSGNLVNGLTEVHSEKLIELLEAPKAFGLPLVDLNLQLNHQLRQNLMQHTRIYEIDIVYGKYSVLVNFQLLKYPPGPIEDYGGSALFLLEKIGWNSWEIIDVKTSEFGEAGKKDGTWN
ncbi:hypothetical protein AWH56_011520 [Anaerobacillus isosaccharinicus]|uniref:Uncharacterized protein n=1 Tax=Anaerobacillus isosaccharinicus TaxID=1532552 RepID=A0A1S2MBH3_9BACI|nr:hypothetical protein [Anaerobacillus isosaccharinicus]MBA5588470.1 hypothetical protein [Anaerobacillus isosaccharinicus]QOY38105.1 hypothetical protein AWH56_011520 [Anaerobacillus isosaccharinicus]